MIDHNSAVPMYIQLAQNLSDAINQGIYSTGDKLPSENELCKHFSVSRITVRQALTLLVQQNLVTSVHGKGTFVKPPSISHDLNKIVSFNHLLQLKGLRGHTCVHSFHKSSFDERAKLFLGDNMSKLSLIGYISEKPAVYYYSFFKPTLGQKMWDAALKAEKSHEAFSTYDLYPVVEEYPVQVEQTISAMNATSELEELLKVPSKKALMVLESIYFSADGTPLEYKLGYYHSEVYSFQLTRQV